jgi:hypothetical protein
MIHESTHPIMRDRVVPGGASFGNIGKLAPVGAVWPHLMRLRVAVLADGTPAGA